MWPIRIITVKSQEARFSFIILSMQRIAVKLKNNGYDVIIGAGLLRRAGTELRRILPSPDSKIFVVTSPTVYKCCGEALAKALHRANLSSCFLEMNDGEPAKRLATVEKLAVQMVRAEADRKSLLVALGGGVVGDCAGFLASIFMRGISVVQIPTTVLAQVDASIGGKTGVNLTGGKNLIGTFHQPKAVLVDPEVLQTLSEREFRAGLFESLKCGVIRDPKLFEFMMQQREKILAQNRKALERVIVDSVRVKASVVAADERESGLRRILNFGHTIGHALEAATGYIQLLHGEAVAWGMLAASAIARDAEFCDGRTHERISAGITGYGTLPRPRFDPDEVAVLLKSDKKTQAGRVHWVLPERVGRVTVSNDVPEAIVRNAIVSLAKSAY